MRILQVVHGFPPNEWAGTELVTLNLSQALRERGHAVAVLTRIYQAGAVEGALNETTYEELPVFQLVNNYQLGSTFQRSYDNPLFNGPFLQVLNRVRPEVIHFQHLQHLSVSFLRLSSALGYPTVLTVHDFFFACQRIHLINAQQQLCPGPEQGERCVVCLSDAAMADAVRRRFRDMQRTLHAPDLVLTPSRFLADRMCSYFPFLEHRMCAVPLGIKPPDEREWQRGPRNPNAPLRILYVGVLAPHKGAHILLDALKGLPRDRVTVSLYGLECPQWQTYTDQLHQAATALPVAFCGTYTSDQLGNILCQHDVLVMPAIWEETFSIVVREAFLAGMPVVAARRGALIEAVDDGVNGLLFAPEDATDLRRCLVRLLTEPELLERLRQARPQVKTLVEYGAEMENVYADAIARRNQQRSADEKEHETSSRVPVFLPHAPRPETEAGGDAVPRRRNDEGGYAPALVKTPLLSVCIPTYNGAAFLAEAIDSVLEQTFRDFELLIVDDGSTDTTLEIARSFHDPRIAVHPHVQRRGIPGNWNRCLSLAAGEYICLFHQDDVMAPTNLARKMQVLQGDPAISLVHSAIELLVDVDCATDVKNWVEPATEDFTVDGLQYFRKLLLRGNLICAPSVVTRRQRLLDLGGFDETLGFTPDYEMWMKLCVVGKVAFLLQPLLQYRWHPQNASHAYRFAQGVEEHTRASLQALAYFSKSTGHEEEQRQLTEVVHALAESRRWTSELEKGKVWLEKQKTSWQRLAQEREYLLQSQQRWIAELEQGKAWLEEQRTNLQQQTEDQAKMIAEQQQWIAELEKGKEWLEEQWHAAQADALRWQNEARFWQDQRWTRVGVRLKMLQPAPPVNNPEPRQETKR
ncbi:MAG: glycosyltransferase [Candidatus Binatia bacterium]